MVSQRGCFVVLLLLAGCSRPKPPPDRPLVSDAVGRALQARAALRDAIECYALAETPEDVQSCLPVLARLAADREHRRLAARARFAIAHAYAYRLHDRDGAIEQFEKVIEMVPTEPIAALAAEQIEAARHRQEADER